MSEINPDVVHTQGHVVVGRYIVRAACRSGRPLVAPNHLMPENLAAYLPLPPVLLVRRAGLIDAFPVSCGVDADRYRATASDDPATPTVSVRFRGFVAEEELLKAYTRAAVFCTQEPPSCNSLATLEAMAASTPVVAADAVALPHPPTSPGSPHGCPTPPPATVWVRQAWRSWRARHRRHPGHVRGSLPAPGRSPPSSDDRRTGA